MNKFDYCGPYKEQIHNFIELKQSLGYKYLTEAKHLKSFDSFTHERYPTASSLSKEIVMQWCSKRSYEKQNNVCSRASIIRQFAIYLDDLGLKPYIIPMHYFSNGAKYVPYIFTDNELHRFMKATHQCLNYSQCPNRQLIMPLLFKIIYCCGLRLSEARLLKVGDVDLDRGILSILNSKKDNSRLVPMTDKLTEQCRNFSSILHVDSDSEPYYFPIRDNTPHTAKNIYVNFRSFLWQAGISHHGRGFGPRIYDFRHTFAVHRLKQWSESGKDLLVYLPVLQTYLGHNSFAETAYYLRLTADVYPDIAMKLEAIYPDIIPVLGGEENE